jgi:hypothetical protein
MQNRTQDTETHVGPDADQDQGNPIHDDATENPLATAEAGIIGLIIAAVTITTIIYLVVLRLWL